MRLIDADALAKECCVRRYEFESCEKCLEDYIGRGGEPICYLEYRGEDVRHAPTIDAIPVEWLEKRRKNLMLAAMTHSTVYGDNSIELCHAVNVVLDMWQKEQEAQDEHAHAPDN